AGETWGRGGGTGPVACKAAPPHRSNHTHRLASSAWRGRVETKRARSELNGSGCRLAKPAPAHWHRPDIATAAIAMGENVIGAVRCPLTVAHRGGIGPARKNLVQTSSVRRCFPQ